MKKIQICIFIFRVEAREPEKVEESDLDELDRESDLTR